MSHKTSPNPMEKTSPSPEGHASEEQQGAGVQHLHLPTSADGLRLDKWIMRTYPHVSFGMIAKLCRKGFLRLDGKRLKTNQPLKKGQTLRLPPEITSTTLLPTPPISTKPVLTISEADRQFFKNITLFEDAHILVLNKPANLAVQGGSGQTRHLDGLLTAMTKQGEERPKLVHRLDKDTSGVIVLAKHLKAAQFYAEAFKDKEIQKIYWALTVRGPLLEQGDIKQPISKMTKSGYGREKMHIDADAGKFAHTTYQVIDRLSKRATWLALSPITGRTHQLRIHCAAQGFPILGDGKYGAKDAFLNGIEDAPHLKKLHLHARQIDLPLITGGQRRFLAPLPSHMLKTWDLLGFDQKAARTSYTMADLKGDLDIPINRSPRSSN